MSHTSRNVSRVSVISIRGAQFLGRGRKPGRRSVESKQLRSQTEDHQKLSPNLRPMVGHHHPEEIRGLAWHNWKNFSDADQRNPWQSYVNNRLVEHRSKAHWCSMVG